MSKLKPFWEPIETAPKDGQAILLLSGPYEDPQIGEVPAKVAIGRWHAEGTSWTDEMGRLDGEACVLTVTGVWFSGGGWFQPNEVTHWAPVPPTNPDYKLPRKLRGAWRQDKIRRQGKQIRDLVQQRDEARKVAAAAVAHQIASSAESRVTRMKAPDWRDIEAKEVWIHACDILMSAEESALLALGRAVKEYRELKEGE